MILKNHLNEDISDIQFYTNDDELFLWLQGKSENEYIFDIGGIKYAASPDSKIIDVFNYFLMKESKPYRLVGFAAAGIDCVLTAEPSIANAITNHYEIPDGY